MITLDEISTERKPLNGPLSESTIDPAMVGHFTNTGSILIRIGLGGSCSMQILAESWAAWPALEWIQRVIQAGSADTVGVRG